MLKALVTGASGFIGSHVARILQQNNYQVRCLTREGKDPHSLHQEGIEIVRGDLRDPTSLAKSLQGIDHLFHVAACYKLWMPNTQEIYDINVQGTQNLLEIAYQQKIKKVIYTSTVGTIGLHPHGKPANEETPIKTEQLKCHYKKSKYQAEKIAIEYFEKGLPIIIVNPSTPLGPGDLKPTPTGKMIHDFLNGKMLGYTDTGLNIIGVEDVAKGHLLAAQQGVPGKRYILGNKNLSLKEIFNHLSQITGIPSPKLKIPYAILPPLAQASVLFAKCFNKEPFIAPDAVKMAKYYMFFDSSKAIEELKLPQTPIEEVLKSTVQWFQSNKNKMV